MYHHNPSLIGTGSERRDNEDNEDVVDGARGAYRFLFWY